MARPSESLACSLVALTNALGDAQTMRLAMHRAMHRATHRATAKEDTRTSFCDVLSCVDNDDAVQRRPYVNVKRVNGSKFATSERMNATVPKRAPGDFTAPVAIIRAAKRGYVHAVRTLLSCPGVDPSIAHNAALIAATKRGHHAVVELLLADSRVTTDPCDLCEALILATARRDERMFTLLFPLVHTHWSRLSTSMQMSTTHSLLELTAIKGPVCNLTLVRTALCAYMTSNEERAHWYTRALLYAVIDGRTQDAIDAIASRPAHMLDRALPPSGDRLFPVPDLIPIVINLPCDFLSLHLRAIENAGKRGEFHIAHQIASRMLGSDNPYGLFNSIIRIIRILQLRAPIDVVVSIVNCLMMQQLPQQTARQTCLNVVYTILRKIRKTPQIAQIMVRLMHTHVFSSAVSWHRSVRMFLECAARAGSAECIKTLLLSFDAWDPDCVAVGVHNIATGAHIVRAGNVHILLALADALVRAMDHADSRASIRERISATDLTMSTIHAMQHESISATVADLIGNDLFGFSTQHSTYSAPSMHSSSSTHSSARVCCNCLRFVRGVLYHLLLDGSLRKTRAFLAHRIVRFGFVQQDEWIHRFIVDRVLECRIPSSSYEHHAPAVSLAARAFGFDL